MEKNVKKANKGSAILVREDAQESGGEKLFRNKNG